MERERRRGQIRDRGSAHVLLHKTNFEGRELCNFLPAGSGVRRKTTQYLTRLPLGKLRARYAIGKRQNSREKILINKNDNKRAGF